MILTNKPRLVSELKFSVSPAPQRWKEEVVGGGIPSSATTLVSSWLQLNIKRGMGILRQAQYQLRQVLQ